MTPKGQQKKKEIIEASIEIIATRGIEALTFDAIATFIGVGKSNVVYHFSSKQDIIAACIELIVFQGLEVIQNRLNKNSESLKEYLLGNVQWLEEYPKHAPVFMYFLYVATFDSKYQNLFNHIRSEGQNRICILLLNEGIELSSKALKQLSISVQNLITAALIEMYTTRSNKKDVEVRLYSEIRNLITGTCSKENENIAQNLI